MALAYQPPGVTVQEVSTPNVAPILQQPTVIAIVGPAPGYIANQTLVEKTTLVDNAWYSLAQNGVNVLTLTVSDGTTTYVRDTDYVFDQTANRLRRNMPTVLPDGGKVCIYYTKSSSTVGVTDIGTSLTGKVLTRNFTTLITNQDNTIDFVSATNNSLAVTTPGVFVANTDYALTGAGTGTVTIAQNNTSTVLGSKQTVYIDYTKSDGTKGFNVAVTLNGTSPVTVASLANSTGHVVKNVADSVSATVQLATKGTASVAPSTSETGDYVVTGTASGLNLGVNRSNGTTTMGVASDLLQVTISYQATPSDYWRPAFVTSLADCIARFGEAFDSTTGVVNSPVTLAGALAFANGASNLIIQPLFHLASPGVQSSAHSPGGTGATTLQDWKDTLVSLQSVDAVNVVVPIISAGGGTESDAQNLLILGAVQQHVNTMRQNQQYIVALCGEDSTVVGCTADAATLRSHASGPSGLQSGTPAEAMVLVSPASYALPNPVTSLTTNVGGQYAAAAIAGALASGGIADSLTRSPVSGFIAINEYRSELDKNTDAASGLLVIENKNNVIRVRDAITVAVQDQNTSELNVIRSKYYMVENIRDTIDATIIGQIVADERAGFTIQLTIQGVLEQMVTEGAVVTYSDIQVSQVATIPTKYQAQFSYLPPFTVKYVNVVFAIDTTSGVTIAQSATQGV